MVTYIDSNDFVTKNLAHFMQGNVNEEELDKFCDIAQKGIEIKYYQKFVTEYFTKMNSNILLYHGLGSGKSITSAICAILRGKKVILLSPASLLENYRREYEKSATILAKETKSVPELLKVTYNSSNVLKQVANLMKLTDSSDNPFDNSTTIIEESQNFFLNVVSANAAQNRELYFKYLSRAKNIRFICLSGTPIIGSPFELVPLFNLLRGKMIDPNGNEFDCFPFDYNEFNELFVNEELNKLKNENIFQERISGLVSYYRGLRDLKRSVVPELIDDGKISCQMNTQQFQYYFEARSYEWAIENMSKFKGKSATAGPKGTIPGKKSSPGAFKSASSIACNLAFPMEIEKEYRKKYKRNVGEQSEKLTVKDIFDTKWKLLETWLAEANKKQDSIAPPEDHSVIAKFYFDNLAQYSAKCKMLLDNLAKMSGKIFIFSRFKRSGTRFIGLMLKEFGYTEINDQNIKNDSIVQTMAKAPRFMIIDGNTQNKDLLMDIFNKEANTRGELCKIVIGSMVVAAGYSIFGIRHICIFEQQFRETTTKQIIGRGIRLCSHKYLPREEREIHIHYYIATASSSAKVSILHDQGMTTDEQIFISAHNRDTLIENALHVIREAAVDCKINEFDNNITGKLICQDWNSPCIFPANVKEHIMAGAKCVTHQAPVELYDFIYDGEKYKIDVYKNIYKDGKLYGYMKKDKLILLEEESW